VRLSAGRLLADCSEPEFNATDLRKKSAASVKAWQKAPCLKMKDESRHWRVVLNDIKREYAFQLVRSYATSQAEYRRSRNGAGHP
jgi:hypothetical protein